MATYIKNKTTRNWERSGWNGVLSFGFTGCVVPFAGAAEKVPAHWLVCDGSAVGRNEYPDLFNCIGETYGAGDGSTTFNLPDFRECVPVGVGENTTHTITDHDIYTLGQFKDDQMQNITGTVGLIAAANPNGAFYRDSGDETYNMSGGTGHNATIKFDASRVARAGTTTHGKQVGVNYIIHI